MVLYPGHEGILFYSLVEESTLWAGSCPSMLSNTANIHHLPLSKLLHLLQREILERNKLSVSWLIAAVDIIAIFSSKKKKKKFKKPQNYQCYKVRSKILASSADKSINPWQREAQSEKINQLPVTTFISPNVQL